MKEGWEIKKLDDVCEVEYGTRVVRKRDGGTIFPVYGGGGATFFMDTFNREDCMVVARFAMSAQCTRFVEGKFFLNDSGLTVRPKNDKELLPDFLNLQILFLNDHIYSLSRGTAQRNLDVPAFRNIKITFPKSLPEQQRIVSILDQAFAAIDKAKANAEQNLKNAKELFESYLQGVFEKKGDGWEERKVKDIGFAQTGTTPKTAEKENYGDFIPFIKPADVDFLGIGDIRYDNQGLSEIGLKKGRKMKSGSILMVCIGATIGKVGFTEREVSCNQQINSLTVKKEFEPKFIYYAMTSREFQGKVLLEGKGAQATLPIINKTKWENLTISFPKSLKEQQTIVRQLDALRAETQKLEAVYQKKIADLEELKKSILQKAFKGELRSPEGVASANDGYSPSEKKTKNKISPERA
jgi:type I restriction enzyme S subunit